MSNIIIIGATSAIAEATARIYAQRGDRLYLLARNSERLSVMASDLEIRGANSVTVNQMDVNNFDVHEAVLHDAFNALETVDVVLISHGTLPDQKACEEKFSAALSELNTNAISTVSMLTYIANYMEAQKSGTIAVITSVAGDRGRQSNYVYGAAKGMLSIYLQGLRNRLNDAGVNVLDIKPGFVDTPMTKDFEKGVLWAKPDVVAKGIVSGIDKNKFVIYTPSFWRIIMLVIRNIPEFLFKKLSL